MKPYFRYILPLASVVLLLSACHRNGRVIPPKVMAEVYADMFIADQWVYEHGLDFKTDSVAVYEPLFEERGYTVEDFRYSVDQYLNDAERYMDVLEKTKFLLQCRLKEADERRILYNRQDSVRAARAAKAVKIDLMQVEGKERLNLLQKFFPMFPVDSIVRPLEKVADFRIPFQWTPPQKEKSAPDTLASVDTVVRRLDAKVLRADSIGLDPLDKPRRKDMIIRRKIENE